ncbi:MAG: cytosolic protein [Vulcanimicrobiota bacterium]
MVQPFLEFFFPAIASAVDWSEPVTSLDKELQAITREAEMGPRECDLLLKVRLLDGRPGWFYFQVEVQAQTDDHFARRVYIYNYRVFDRFGEDLCSLAILGDTSPTWRPRSFMRDRFGCRLEFHFPTVKLLDLRPRLAELEEHPNPFAAFVSFHLWTQATQGKYRRRVDIKARLHRGLFHRGLSRADILKLAGLLDWMMTLPPPYSLQFAQKLAEYEKEDAVPYIHSFEQMGIEKGLEQGRQEGLEQGRQVGLEQGRQVGLEQGRQVGLEQGRQVGLEQGQIENSRWMVKSLLSSRFGELPAELEASLAKLNDLEELRQLALKAAQVGRLEDFLL